MVGDPYRDIGLAYLIDIIPKYNNNKKAQKSLLSEKMHYSLYSFCCSTDLQGHPSSMIFISSEKVRYG